TSAHRSSILSCALDAASCVLMHEDERTLMLLMAYAHLQQRSLAKAEVLYAALLSIDPDDAVAAKGLACVQLESESPQAALTVLDSIADPGDPGGAVRFLRARAFAQLERVEDAQLAMQAFRAARRSTRRVVDEAETVSAAAECGGC